jgi:L-fuconolactonase
MMTSNATLPAIDAHQHFWDPATGDYSWMTPDHAKINRVFAPDDLRGHLGPAGVDGTILVQTWSSLDETRRFLALAEVTDFVLGVVGWVDMTSGDFGQRLGELLESENGKWLVGIRHQVHDEPDPDWLLRDDVRNALAEISRRGLAYDLLIRPREMPAAILTARDFPDLRLVVDHIAKPDIAHCAPAGWTEQIAELAEHRSHVWCKLSGMVTEASWNCWRLEDFAPYIAAVLDRFGPDRCMIGSDWPVCTLAASYRETMEIVRHHLSGLSEREQRSVLQNTAIDAYQLGGR